MPRKPRRNVPKILWRLFRKKANNLKDTILHLISSRNILPEQCRCRNRGCLGCSRDKSSFLLRPDDPNHYRKLLHSCFVVNHGKPLSFQDFSPTSGWSQREIVERIIEMMEAGRDCKNVICARYNKYDQSSHMVELLTTSSWEFLLNRVGHDFMVHLLQYTLVFLPFPGQKHKQVCGPPLFIKQNKTSIVQENKRKREDNVQPSNKRHQFSSAVHVCPEVIPPAVASIVRMDAGQHRVEKPCKRSRLYLKRRRRQKKINFQNVDNDAPCTNSKASTGNEAHEKTLHISMNRSLTDFAKQTKPVKRKTHFKLNNSETFPVIPSEHILSTLKPNCSGSKLLMNHIFGEVDDWSTASYHGKGNCPSGAICLYHSLLKSLKSLIGKTKSSHLKTLLDKHCPVLLQGEDSLKSANVADQSHRSCSRKGKTKCPSDEESKLYCTNDQVVSFIWAICQYIVPESLLGTTHQMRVLRRNIAWFISLRKNEKCSVKQFLHKVKPSDFPFFDRKQLCCMAEGHEFQNESMRSTQQMLCMKWISWLFLDIVKKLVPFNFYITESQEGRLKNYYYRKCSWKSLIRKEISKSLDGYVQMDDVEAESRKKKLRLLKYRIIPKANGVRMLFNFSSLSRLQSLCDTHAVLKDIQLKEPDVFGSSISDHDDVYRNLAPYLIHLRNQSGEIPPLFFVVADVFKAFDSVDQGKLISVLQCVLKDEHILSRCRLVCCGKGLPWVNNILVSSDKMATFSRFTSNNRYDARQSIIVDKGENYLLRKADLMRWIESMLKNNMLQLGKSFYLQIAGIPQGHRLSSLLCCLYYGHLERTLIYPFLEKATEDESAKECNREKELITPPPSYKLLRLVDDYLFVSTSREQATSFYQRLKHGFPDYNCFMNEKKFCINFKDDGESRGSSNMMYVGDNGVPFIRWTGLLINSRTSEVQADYTRYLSGHIRLTFCVAWQKKPVRQLREKLCDFLVLNCKPIFFDSNINSRAIVRLNIYQIFLLAAMKFHCYVYELSRFWKLDPRNLAKFITRSIRFMFRHINRRMHRFNTRSSNFRPVLKLYKEEVVWLGLHAFIQVLKKKNSRYRTILIYLKSALSKRNLSLSLWPDLEYATDRSNSSSLWKLKY